MYRFYLLKEPNEPGGLFIDELRALPLRSLWKESFPLIAEEFCFASCADATLYMACEREKEELDQQIAVLDAYQRSKRYVWEDLSELAHAKEEIEAQVAVIASYQALLPIKAGDPQCAAVSNSSSCGID